MEFLKNILSHAISIPIWILLIVIIVVTYILKKYLDDDKNRNDQTDIVSVMISMALLLVTTSLYTYQTDTLKSENTPYPYLTAIEAHVGTDEEEETLNIRNPVNFQGESIMLLYYYGKQEALYYDEIIKDIGIELLESNPEDRKIINEIKNNEGSICFSKINDHNCILFINENIKDSFVFEYCSAYIKIKNYGAFFHNVQLESMGVFYTKDSGGHKVILDTENTEQKSIPLVVQPDETIELVYCQVINNLENNQGLLTKDIVAELGNSYDLLTKRMPVSYDKMEIIISCENFMGEKFRYKLIFEKQGYYYVSKTELLN